MPEAERNRIKERIAQVKRDQKARGPYLGGIAPWGFRRGPDGGLVPGPEKQATIARMRELRAAGMSLRKIMERMNAEGVPVTLPTLMKLTAA